METTSSATASTPAPAPTPTPTNTPTSSAGSSTEPPKSRLTSIEIDNEITALNVMVQFLGLAQKRGAFTIDEAAKIWECVKKFQRPDVVGA